MRRKGLWLSVLATALIAGNASAAPMTIDGDWEDWFDGTAFATVLAGSGTPTNNSLLGSEDWNVGANSYAINPFAGIGTFKDPDTGVGPGGQNGPAVGGQPYDAEQFFWYGEAGFLYVGLFTGFSPNGESGAPAGAPTNGFFQSGDLFINLDNIGAYEVAVGTSVTDGRAGNYWENGAGLAVENNYYNPNHSVSDPYRVASSDPDDDPDLADFAWQQYGSGSTRRYFYEFSIDLTAFDLTNSLVGLHWTMECGNDNINAVIPIGSIPNDPVVPVPAAAPLGLLGMGLIALVRRVRRRTEC